MLRRGTAFQWSWTAAVLLAWMIVVPLGCGEGDGEDAATDRGDDDDDTVPDIPLPDDDDDDGGDDDDDDDDTGPDDDDDDDDDDIGVPASAVLLLTPDPEDLSVQYFPGAVFTYIVGLLDSQENYLGEASGYTLTIDPTGGVTHDDVNQTLTFNREGSWDLHAETTAEAFVTPTVTVDIVELQQADIIFFTPDRGQFITSTADPGGSITVTGECTVEGNPCDFVEINGLAPDDYDELSGEFEIVFGLEEGLNTIIAEGFNNRAASLGDANISTLYGDFLPNSQIAADAVGVRVSNEGLQTISAIAEDLLADLNIEEYLPGPANPDCPTDPSQCHLYDEYVDVWGIETGATADITGVGYDPIQIELTATQLGLNLQAEVTNLDIAVHADYKILDIPGSLTGNIRADSLYLWAVATIGVNPDGTPNVQITEVTPTITNLRFENFGLLGDILSLFTGAVTPIIESILPDLIAPELNDAIEDILADLDLSTDFDLLGKTFFLGAEFSEMAVDQYGISAWMDAQLTADTIDPNVPSHPGSWKKSGDRPFLTGTLPGLGVYGLGVVLDDDIVNQILYEIYRSGALNYDITDAALTTTILSPFFPQLLLIHPSAPVIIRLEPLLPPILNVSGTDGLDTEIQLGDFLVELIVDHPVDGEVSALKAALSLSLPASIDVDANGSILLDIDAVDYFFEVTIIEEAYNFNDALLEDFIPTLVDFLLPLLTDLLGAIDIPSFEGYTLDILAIEASGADQDFIGLYGDLAAE